MLAACQHPSCFPWKKSKRPVRVYWKRMAATPFSTAPARDIHLCEISAIIDRELFNFYREHNWSPPTRKESAQRRAEWFVEEMSPLFQHPDLGVSPFAYNNEEDKHYHS